MTIAFDDSRTRENLMRAFAGESQARNRYIFAAQQADQSRLRLVADAFRFTAAQEKEHAETFYKLLASCAGQTITVDGGYPVNRTDRNDSFGRPAGSTDRGNSQRRSPSSGSTYRPSQQGGYSGGSRGGSYGGSSSGGGGRGGYSGSSSRGR